MIKDRILRIQCVGLENGGVFPMENTGRGRDVSPEFVLEHLSPAAKTVAITLEDIAHPLFKDFTHWVIWNIPASEHIAGAIPHGKRVEALGGAIQGIAYGRHRYAGPKPPKGKRHQYRFTVYVLDTVLPLAPYATKKKLLRSARNHILQQGSVVGLFG